MAIDYCKYHPLTLATWHCSGCHINVCDDCTHMTSDVEAQPQCLLCNQPLTMMNAERAVPPFWQNFTDFLRLPFNLWGLMWLVVVALLVSMASQLPMLFVVGLGFFISTVYGWCLLQQLMLGEFKPPTLAVLSKLDKRLAVEMSAFLTALLVGAGIAAERIPWLATLLMLGVVVLMPLWLMAVAVDKSITALWQAHALKHVLSAIQFVYLPIAFTAVGLSIALYSMVHLLADVLPMTLNLALRQVVYAYGVWVIMAVSGYTVYQFHKALQLELTQKKTRKRVVMRKLDNQTNRLEVYLKEGLYDRAAALLKSLAEKQKKDPEIQARYYHLLVFMQDKEQIPYQASNYLEALLEVGQMSQALQVLNKLQYLMPDFRPQTPDICFDLAKACVEEQDYQRAVNLLTKMHQHYPNYANLPEAYLLLAKLWHDKLADKHQALEVLEYLVLRFTRHPRFPQIQAYWRELGGKPKEDFLL
ncbi:B-box zinc finger protein [Agitococcus lubricus]|uniref:Tetratricopeptide repeat protein n=1 Tax=Agitococcus lubricus TaxID=1077255 RepID=A0A2T5IWF0_9GAMM|nr:B-box zinc finger protein [Agitococcus lubricus]PTQ88158.1 hypothetical protein C8N29_11416 [Agitococcus lubricus]